MDLLSPLSAEDTVLFFKNISDALHDHLRPSSNIARELYTLAISGDLRAIATYALDPSDFSDPEEYYFCAQIVAMCKKYPDLPGYDLATLEGEAWERFKSDEGRCKLTNEFFRGLRNGTVCAVPAFAKVLYQARSKIAKMLGKAPKFSDIRPKLGPGASTETPRRRATASHKLTDRLCCSPASVQYLSAILESMPHLAMSHLSKRAHPDTDYMLVDVTVTPAVLGFVEKDAFKLRSIAVEPLLTSMYQLGIGEILSVLLKRHGIDLKDQSINARRAKVGSITGILATLDLSSASDLISYELVRFLLPWDWFELLRAFRSPVVTWSGGVAGTAAEVVLEKFSSMGNGYTFPLESLIFYSLCVGAECTNVSVYGDDIICEAKDAPRAIQALEMSGFLLNKAKSFVSGSFRESCGSDFLNGFSVRPWFLKKKLTPYVLLGAHNYFVRRYGTCPMSEAVLSFIPPPLRLYGPDGYGDGHLLSTSRLKPHGRDAGWGGYTFETYSLKGRTSTQVHKGDHIALLYTTYVREDDESDSHGTTVGSTRRVDGLDRVVKAFPRTRSDVSYSKVRIYTFSH